MQCLLLGRLNCLLLLPSLGNPKFVMSHLHHSHNFIYVVPSGMLFMPGIPMIQ